MKSPHKLCVCSILIADIMATIFTHISNTEEELIRERAMKYLAAKLASIPKDVLTQPIEDFIVEQTKKVSRLALHLLFATCVYVENFSVKLIMYVVCN